MKAITALFGSLLLALSLYSVVGVGTRVEEIKRRAPSEIDARNWRIIRYEGYQFGSWQTHGGKVWYHVADKTNPNIQYRVFICLWGGELQWYYKAPEVLSRIEISN